MTRPIRPMSRLFRAAAAMPWAILPERLGHVLAVLERHEAGLRLSADEVAAAIGDNPKRGQGPAMGAVAVAVLPLYGIIAQRAAQVENVSGPGGTSCELFGKWFDAALGDPSVGAIVLDVDSPGGAVPGVDELARKIADARGRKPIVAVANATAASAAYWIASAADEVVVTATGLVGSIGVFALHEDISAALEMEGVKATIISAGKYKIEGNELGPLSDDARAAVQARIDSVYGQFVRAVATHRGVSDAAVRSGYGEGRVLMGRDAVAAGLADRVGTLDATVARLARSARAGSAARAPRAAGEAASVRVELAGVEEIAATVAALAVTEAGYSTTYITTAAQPAASGAGAPLTDASPMLVGVPQSEPAPRATESAMSNTDTAAEDRAAPTPNAVAADIARLCAAHGKPELAAEYIAAGMSVHQAGYELLKAKQAKQAATHVTTDAAAPILAPRVTGGVPNEARRPFATFGEQLVAIARAGMPGGRIDQRLLHINATASGMNEGVGSEGGFFIQPELLPGVIDPVYNEDPILSRVTRIPIGSGTNGVRYNVVDETSRVNGSRWGGIQMYWAAEADTATAKKPKLRLMELDLKKIIGIGYLTDELSVDAPAAEALLGRAFNAELAFMLGAGVFTGSGAGQMLGFMNSGALVTQAIESTQTIANTATFVGLNVTKMLSRIPASLWGGTIFLYNQELLPYLVNATAGSSGVVPLFVGAGGLANRPFDTILGRPAFASELCEAVGTPGDLLAVAPSEYHMIDKGGAQQATSLHVRFLNDETALRITYRTDGAPVWKTAITPYKGANTRSPFVALATRS